MKTLIRYGLPLLLLIAPPLHADQLQFSSRSGQVTMLELYTSQGCSSCPPADRWLSTLREHPKLWSELIPLAFHVDYWDRLGWKDPFGSAQNTRRQYDFNKTGKTSAVYTPGFILNGKEWRSRGRSNWLQPEGLSGQQLDVQLDGDSLSVRYGHSTEPLQVNIALLGFGLETRVGAGENHRKTLREDFVVLAWDPFTIEKGHWQGRLPVSATETERRALVVWISEPERPSPLQATGGWLPEKR